MSVESLKDYDIYIDVYEDADIVVSSTSNHFGQIRNDDNGNSIGSKLHAGSNFIQSCTANTFSNGFLIYDDKNFKYFEGTFSSPDFMLKQNQVPYYKIEVEKEVPTVNNTYLELDLSSKSVFGVFINGRFFQNDYTVTTTEVQLTTTQVNLISGIDDDIFIITYPTSQTISTQSLTLSYKAPTTLLPSLTNLEDETAFTSMIQVCDFRGSEGFTASVNKTLNKIEKPYQYVQFKKEVNRESKITISTFSDYRENINGEQFRILAWNKTLRKLIIFNNCIWQDGESQDFKFVSNDMSLSIDFEDEIIIEYQENGTYGIGAYGEGYYGGLKLYSVRA